jgi:hypothetical protein
MLFMPDINMRLMSGNEKMLPDPLLRRQSGFSAPVYAVTGYQAASRTKSAIFISSQSECGIIEIGY